MGPQRSMAREQTGVGAAVAISFTSRALPPSLYTPPPPARPPPRRSWLLAHTHVTLGWVFNVCFSLGLVYCSTWLVVNVAPEAGGAGVSEVMAYLNGVFIPKVGMAWAWPEQQLGE